jgi:hypothetical protein
MWAGSLGVRSVVRQAVRMRTCCPKSTNRRIGIRASVTARSSIDSSWLDGDSGETKSPCCVAESGSGCHRRLFNDANQVRSRSIRSTPSILTTSGAKASLRTRRRTGGHFGSWPPMRRINAFSHRPIWIECARYLTSVDLVRVLDQLF